MIGAVLALWKIPWVRQAISYAAIGLVALWLLRMYSNAQYNKGFDKGKVQGVQDTLDAHKKDWEQAQKDLDAAAQQLGKDRTQLEADRVVVVSNRTAIVATLTKGQAALGQKIDALKTSVALVPADQLDVEIRRSLDALR